MSRSQSIKLRRSAALLLFGMGLYGTFGAACGAQSPSSPVLAVLCKAESLLSIIDPATGKVLGRVPTGPEPHEVVVASDAKLAIVANYGGPQPGSTLSIIDLGQRKEIRRVELGALRRPHGLAEVDGKLFFTAEVNSAVARYDLQSDRLDWLVGTGEAGTHMLVATPDGERVYTANIGSNSVTSIQVNSPRGNVVKRIPVGRGPEGIALSPDGKEVWVGHQGGGISIINTAIDSVKGQIETPDVYLRLVFTPDGKRVLAPEVKSGALVVYEAQSHNECARIPVGQVPVGITLDGEGRRAFISSAADNKVVAVDLEKLTVVGSFSPGQTPDGIAWAGPGKARPAMRKRGVLGVAVAPLPNELRQLHKLDTGVIVRVVTPGSPAAAAGLEKGDVILGINGEAVDEPGAFAEQVYAAYAGDVLTLELLRDGKKLTAKATLAPRPQG